MLGLLLKQGTCKRRLPESPSLDRLIPERGYVPGNVAVISWRANTIKSNADYRQIGAVYRWLKRLTKSRRGTPLKSQ